MKKIVLLMRYTVLILMLSSCSYAPFLYQPDVVQGTTFTKEQIAQIVPNMSRDEVYQILGTPSIQDPFHNSIDQYIFSFKSGKTHRSFRRNLTIVYDNNNRVLDKNETPLIIK